MVESSWQFNNAGWQVGKLATSTSFTLFFSMISQSRWLVSIKSVSSYLQQLVKRLPRKLLMIINCPNSTVLPKQKHWFTLTNQEKEYCFCYYHFTMYLVLKKVDNFGINSKHSWKVLIVIFWGRKWVCRNDYYYTNTAWNFRKLLIDFTWNHIFGHLGASKTAV